MNEAEVSAQRMKAAAELLVEDRDPDAVGWWWLEDSKGGRPSKTKANKFLLACILDYQIRAEKAWANARRLAEDILGDPESLWNVIADFSEDAWADKFGIYKLHRFPVAHMRVWRIGRDVVDRYDGDARKIWTGKSPAEVLQRFDELRLGEQLGRMAVGGLLDTGQISGTSDVKADVHVRRVLGRILIGRMLSADEAIAFARDTCPENPWLLDGGLYLLGKSVCRAQSISCGDCKMADVCVTHHGAVTRRPRRRRSSH